MKIPRTTSTASKANASGEAGSPGKRPWAAIAKRAATVTAVGCIPFIYMACSSGVSGEEELGKLDKEKEETFGSVGARLMGDDFDRIRRVIDMKWTPTELPVPDYEEVDVAGSVKNAPDSIACGGTVSEGAADTDDCLLRNQIVFNDGYISSSSTVVSPNAATYNDQLANLEIQGKVGDIVEFTVKNLQPEAVDEMALDTGFFSPANNLQLIHWHGMELDNESDGTPATEVAIQPGESRLYRYRLYRPGLWWFHPHIRPLNTESRGQVGRLIVRDEPEEILENIGVLPSVYKAFTLLDVTVANEFNRTRLGPGQVEFPHFTDEEVDNHLMPDKNPDLNGDGVCDRGVQGRDCIVEEGELVLVNGVVPTSDANIPTVEVEEGGGARLAFVNSSSERFFRFRLLLEGESPPPAPTGGFAPAERVGRATTGQCYADAISPKFSGIDPLSCDQGLPLYRTSGEGGILNNVRLEGQPELGPGDPPRPFDTVIRTGEDAIGPSERTELTLVTKDREGNYLEPGQSMYIWNIDFPHGIFTPAFDNTIGDGSARNRDIAPRKLVRILVVPNTSSSPPFDIAEDDPLATHPAVNRPLESIRSLPLDSLSAVPSGNDAAGNPFLGTTDNHILLGNTVNSAPPNRFPSINNVKGVYDGFEFGIGDTLPTQDATRYAHVGNVIEWVYANNTGNAHHPLHMHGFSFQPISIHPFTTEDANGDGFEEVIVDPQVLYDFDYDDIQDVQQTQPGTALRFRMKMNDRFKMPDKGHFSIFDLEEAFPYDKSQLYGGPGDIANVNADMGGALGRWLFHCHILHHAEQGMIADFCVAPQGAPEADCKIDVDETIPHPIDVLSFEPFAAWTRVQGSGDVYSGDGTDGFGLAVTSGGFTEFVSDPLTTDIVQAKSSSGFDTALLDLNVSANQSNPSWAGAVQLYVHSPSAGVFHAFVGQVELQPLTKGQFVTVSFNIPSSVDSVFQGSRDDIQFYITTNTTSGSGSIVMDDLRFQ